MYLRKVWKFGSLEVWTRIGGEVWKFGSLGVWKFGSLGVWEFGTPVHQKPSPYPPNFQTSKLPNFQTPKLPNFQTPKLPKFGATESYASQLHLLALSEKTNVFEFVFARITFLELFRVSS